MIMPFGIFCCLQTDFSRPHAFPTNIVDNKTQAALQAGFGEYFIDTLAIL